MRQSRRVVEQMLVGVATRRYARSLEPVGMLIDGVEVASHCVIVALGTDATGAKHALGLWDGATENATVCRALLGELQQRGLRTDLRSCC